MRTTKMNTLLLPLLLILTVATVCDSDSWWRNKSEYRTITNQWATVLTRKGIEGEPKFARVTLESTRAILEAINKRRPSHTKAALIEMANVSEAKCELEQIKAMVSYMDNYWELPSAIQSYIDHHLLAQFESCAAKFKGPMREGERALYDQDPDWLPSLERCVKGKNEDSDRDSDSIGPMLADYLIEEFEMSEEAEMWEIEDKLDTMARFCKGTIMKKLEPGARVMVQFRASTYKDYASKRSGSELDLSWLELLGYYEICLRTVESFRDVMDEIDIEMSHRREKAKREREEEESRAKEERKRERAKKYGPLILFAIIAAGSA